MRQTMDNTAMPYLPTFIAPSRFTDPAAALAKAREIYDASLNHLRVAMQRFVAGDTLPGNVRACYPFVRVQTDTVARRNTSESARLSYGFVAGPGRFETTLTRPAPTCMPTITWSSSSCSWKTTRWSLKLAPARNRFRCIFHLQSMTTLKAA